MVSTTHTSGNHVTRIRHQLAYARKKGHMDRVTELQEQYHMVKVTESDKKATQKRQKSYLTFGVCRHTIET